MREFQMPSTRAEALELLGHLQQEADRRSQLHALRNRVVVGCLATVAVAAVAVGVVRSVHPGGVAPTAGTAKAQTTTRKGATAPSHQIYGVGTGVDVPWHPRLDSFGGPLDKQAQSVSLAAAQQAAGFQLAVPGPSTVASPAGIQRVWLLPLTADGEQTNIVSIDYPNLEIVQQQMPAAYDGPTAYAGMVAQQADPGDSTQQLNGTTAYTAPPYTDSQGIKHPGYVQYTINHVQTTIEGYYPATTLTQIASAQGSAAS